MTNNSTLRDAVMSQHKSASKETVGVLSSEDKQVIQESRQEYRLFIETINRTSDRDIDRALACI